MRKTVKVYLCNVQTLGAMCGYGTGRTKEEAVADALRQARERDPRAFYDQATNQVKFAGGVNC
jgi:hypothetical protein